MAAAELVFIYNFGFRRAREPILVSIPPEIGIPDTPESSILHYNASLDEKSNMTNIPGRSSAVEL